MTVNMNAMHAKLSRLKGLCPDNYWAKRILAELEYANRVSLVADGRFDDLIDSAVSLLLDTLAQSGTVCEETAVQAERLLADMAGEAKKYTVLCASHAHIDMNFLWGWDETVSITLNTFRTMLDLLDEYPDFLFSQSQAAAYEIVEKYDPEMLEEIKRRVAEGRWEVTASTWVEADKNMPNGESMARQVLTAKTYLGELFGLAPDALAVDFEPDTFGHSANVPELLQQAGIKYYYYCRGHNNEGHHLFRWMSLSGRSVIAYKEPHWYDSRIEPAMVMTVPEFCRKTNMTTMLKVYGVGDHGGGPTRRDLERALDMRNWPIFPTIRFGTYHEFFELAEQTAGELPVVQNELNFIFTGCYTSQARIKKANRVSENLLGEAERFGSLSTIATGARYYGKELTEAWRKTLFNQFHDILPGSCVPETRDHALGYFQEIVAMANSKKSDAIRRLAAQIDTSRFIVEGEDLRESMSEGAGAGVGVHLFRTGESDRGRGKTRIFHVFNSAHADRGEVLEIVIWDWDGDLSNLSFQDGDGTPVDFQFVDRGFAEHWGHFFLRVLLPVRVSAMGYNTYVMTEKAGEMSNLAAADWKLAGENLPPNELHAFVLENDQVKAVLDPSSLALLSLVDKDYGLDALDGRRPAGFFRLIEEDTFGGGGNAWLVGRYGKIEPLTEGIRVEKSDLGKDKIRQSVTYAVSFRSSKLKVVVSLDRNSASLNYSVECDWHEIGGSDTFAPQLQFYMPVGYACGTYRYDIPFGTIDRPAMAQDVPANSWALALPQDAAASRKAVMVVSDDKYGFRGTDDALIVNLIRGSHGPDPYPENGVYRFQLAVGVVDPANQRKLIETAYAYNNPLSFVSVAARQGNWPLSQSLLRLEEGSVAVSAVKMPEVLAGAGAGANGKCIVRVYETDGIETTACLASFRTVKRAYYVDVLERAVEAAGSEATHGSNASIAVEGSLVRFQVGANQVVNLCLEFE